MTGSYEAEPSFRRGTTPTIEVEVEKDVTDLVLHLSFAQDDVLVVKEGDDLEVVQELGVTTVKTVLTQEDTLKFRAGGYCEVQIRGYKDGGLVAMATGCGKLKVLKVLEEGVLPHED